MRNRGETGAWEGVSVHVSRIGFTPLKGTRHTDQPYVDLTLDGPVGDRVFCFVDPSRGRVLRTVEHPTLMQTRARWQDGVLTTELPAGVVSGVPVPTGDVVKVDYWGRTVALEVQDGPWAAAYSAHLGCEVTLARFLQPGDIVYGGSVSLVSSSSLERLTDRLGVLVDDAQLRATFTVSTENEPAHVEDSWLGRRLRLGEAEVQVRSALPRCAVVDFDPRTGARRGHVLRAMAGYRLAGNEIMFAVDADVVRPGRVDLGAPVERG
jgi:uncharacterized protein YcbX